MMEDKNIDRLFQEKLKDMEIHPRPEVWQNIEKKLSQKKKRRVFPIWWLSGGTAAMLILGLFLYNTIDINNNENLIDISNESIEESIQHQKNEVVHQKTTETSSDVTTNMQEEREINTPMEERVLSPNLSTQNKTNREAAVISEHSNNLIGDKKIAVNKNLKGSKIIDGNTTSQQNFNSGKLNDKKIAMDQNLNNPETSITKNEQTINQKNNNPSKPTQNPIANDIPLNPNMGVEKDKSEAKKQLKKWEVSPVVGISNSNSLTQASAIDSRFDGNEIVGKSNITYGLNVAYEINNKWSLQSGVYIQNHDFITKDVGFRQSLQTSRLENGNLDPSKGVELFSNKPSQQVADYSDQPLNFNDFNDDVVTSSDTSEIGQLTQTISYFEVPLEVGYTFFDNNTISTTLISGMSTLFLRKNVVSGTSETYNLNFKYNNLNTVNFSGNVGVGLDYALFNNLKLNLTPSLKIPINMFTESNNFQPYTFTIYSGLKYQF